MRGQCYEKPLEHPLHFATKKGLLKTLPKAKKITPTKIDFSMEKKNVTKIIVDLSLFLLLIFF